MLELFKLPPIENENFIFQQDQAPSHFATTQDFLNHKYRLWIGRGRGMGSMATTLPRITSMYFYFRCHVEQRVYGTVNGLLMYNTRYDRYKKP